MRRLANKPNANTTSRLNALKEAVQSARMAIRLHPEIIEPAPFHRGLKIYYFDGSKARELRDLNGVDHVVTLYKDYILHTDIGGNPRDGIVTNRYFTLASFIQARLKKELQQRIIDYENHHLDHLTPGHPSDLFTVKNAAMHKASAYAKKWRFGNTYRQVLQQKYERQIKSSRLPPRKRNHYNRLLHQQLECYLSSYEFNQARKIIGF